MEHLEEKSPENVTQEKPIIVKTTWPKAFSSLMGKFIITVGIIIILSIVFIQINKLIDKTSKVAIEVASVFKTGTIKTEFIEYASMIDMTNHLQIATLKCKDNFYEQDSRSILNTIPLPDIKVEMRCPVEYTFYLDLESEKWDFIMINEDLGIIVIAPKIECNTPAVDISKLEIEVDRSIFRNEDKLKEKIKKNITIYLKSNARKNVCLIRESARVSTKKFIENWFFNSRFKGYKTKPYVQEVFFADEERTYIDKIKKPFEASLTNLE